MSDFDGLPVETANEMMVIKHRLIKMGYTSRFSFVEAHRNRPLLVWRIWGTITKERRPDLLGVGEDVFTLMRAYNFTACSARCKMDVDERFGDYPNLHLHVRFTRTEGSE
jgi:hypothetical protein